MTPRLRVTAFAALATLLGSLALLPIYDSYGWLPRVFAIVAVVALTSALAHRVRVLSAAAPLLMVVTWLIALTVMYVHGVAPFGFFPGPAALRQLHETVSDGFTDTTQLAAPVPVTSGLSLLTTGGIGLVAIMVETLTTGLRRPAIAGLPLLAIFTIPAAILRDGVGWRPFVFAAAGYLALLLAEGRDRITHWGRTVRPPRPAIPTARPPGTGAAFGASGAASGTASGAASAGSGRRGVATNQLTQLGRRVGAAAIGVAVVVPVLIPGLHAGWFGTHHTRGVGGLSLDDDGGASINPIVSVRRDLQRSEAIPLFRYATNADNPDYLRMLTLDRFTGVEWSASSVASQQDVDAGNKTSFPRPAGVSIEPIGTVQTDVTISGLKEPYLPAPMVPLELRARGDWTYNPVTSVLYSTHSSTLHLSYSVISAVYDPPQALLDAARIPAGDPALQPYLQVPNVPPEIKAQADAVVAQAHARTPYQIAVALQNWFQSEFIYDLSVVGSNTNALLSFLHDRRGYCEQFAATMALMARLEGIPARVDIGFTPGTPVASRIADANTREFEVTTDDAHAWPELYFPGAGWLRFEPTPRGDGQTTTPAYSQPTAPAPSDAPTSSAVAAAPSQDPATADPHRVPGLRPSGDVAGGGASDLPVGWLALLSVVVLAAAAAPAVRWWTRRRRWRDAEDATGTVAERTAARAHAAWAELGDDLSDLRLPWLGTTDSPRRAAAALLSGGRLEFDAAAKQALLRLSRAEEIARYAGPRASGGGVDLRAEQEKLCRALYASVPPVRRLRARLAPASTGRTFGRATAATSERVRGLVRRVADGALAKLPAR
jgi:transglutaminase-like putative cysteine protease